jgi:hypothetical protein
VLEDVGVRSVLEDVGVRSVLEDVGVRSASEVDKGCRSQLIRINAINTTKKPEKRLISPPI